MNLRSLGWARTPYFHQLKICVAVVGLLSIGAFCQVVNAQSVESRPVARIIGSTPSLTRARRVNSTGSVAASTRNSGLECEEANPVELRAFEQTNIERVKHGLQPFVWDSDLLRMARQHSENMARTGYFSHVTPKGIRLRDRARAVGIESYTVLGENIAYNLGYDDPGTFAVERWMISAGHRANILSPQFRAMAVGTFVGSDGAVFLTQTFITR